MGHVMLEEFRLRIRTYSCSDSDRAWFPRWIKRFAQFCKVDENDSLDVERDGVIAFCRGLRDRGVPAWQRLQAVRCLTAYRSLVLQQTDDVLQDIRRKLHELAEVERNRRADDPRPEPTVEDGAPAKVNEPAAVTEFRRTLRRHRKKYATESAYAGWVVRFLRFHHTQSADHLGEESIRVFLTEVALGNAPGQLNRRSNRRVKPGKNRFESDVDWDLSDDELVLRDETGTAANTLIQAKSALLYFFQKHLGRELGFIDCGATGIPPKLPVVMTRDEICNHRGLIVGDLQQLMYDWVYGAGFRHKETTMIYTHVMNRPGLAVTSPLDRLQSV